MRAVTLCVFAMALAAPASAQVLRDPWVRTDRSVDCRSRQTILADILKGDMTEEAKAVAIWRFMMDHTWHFSRADAGHPMHVLNVYGYSLCGTLSELQNYLRAGAFPASYVAHGGCERYGSTRAEREKICRGWLIDSWKRLDAGQDKPGPGRLGHSMGDVYYDGAWHFLDCHGGFYVYTADSSRIAGYHDLQSDPTLVSDPVKTSDPFMPYDGGQPLFYYRFNGSGGRGTPDPKAEPAGDRKRGPEPSMAVTLRPGEKYIRSWQPIPGAFKWSASWKGQWDERYIGAGPRHVPSGPETFRRYANGQFIHELPLDKPAAVRAGLATADNVAFAAEQGGDKATGRPALRQADPGRPMTLALDVRSPYVLIRGRLTGRLIVPPGASASVAVRIGAKATTLWQSDKAGPIDLDVGFDKELGYGYEYQIVLSLSAGADKQTPGGLDALRLETVFQLNPLTLPRLRPGANTVTVSLADANDLARSPLRVTYAWREKSGPRQHTHQVTADPKSQRYSIEVGDVGATDPADPSYMGSVELEWPP